MRGGTSVDELLTILRAKRRRLPSEIGVFVALQTAELLLDRAFRIDATRVFVLEDGSVALDSEERCDDATALSSVRELLESLLVAADEGVPPMILSLVDRGAGAPTSLSDFLAALEASLVPLNRGASRRVLARSLRDIRRERATTTRSMDAADADFDALLEGKDAPDRAETLIVDPEIGAPQQARRDNASGTKRSIFRDEPATFGADVDERESSTAMLYVAVAALALAVLGGIVYFTR